MASTPTPRDFGPASPDRAGFLVFLARDAHRYRTHHQSPAETRNPRANTPRPRQKRLQQGPSSEQNGPSSELHRPLLKQQASSPKQRGPVSEHQGPSLEQQGSSSEQRGPSSEQKGPLPRQHPATEVVCQTPRRFQCHAPVHGDGFSSSTLRCLSIIASAFAR